MGCVIQMAKIGYMIDWVRSRRPKTSYDKAAKQLAIDILFLKGRKLGMDYDVSTPNMKQSIGYPEAWERDGKIKDFIADAYMIYKPGISQKKLLYSALIYIERSFREIDTKSWKR